MNQDLVAVEIFEEEKWINKGGQADVLVTDLLERLNEGEEQKDLILDEESKVQTNLIEVLENTKKQPIGRIIGILD